MNHYTFSVSLPWCFIDYLQFLIGVNRQLTQKQQICHVDNEVAMLSEMHHFQFTSK